MAGASLRELDEAVVQVQSALEQRLRAILTGSLVTLTVGATSEPGWGRILDNWVWAHPVKLSIDIAGQQGTAQVLWPALWDASAPCPDANIRLGTHRGFYLGRPLAINTPVALRPGVHAIARSTGPQWRVDAVISPEFGPTYRVGSAETTNGAKAECTIFSIETSLGLITTGLGKTRYLTHATRKKISQAWGSETTDQISAEGIEHWLGRSLSAARSGTTRIWRASAEANRLMTPHDIVADALHTGISRMLSTDRVRRRRLGPDSDKLTLADYIMSMIARGAQGALLDLAAGRNGLGGVLTDPGIGTTLARVESGTRVTFIGYRGLSPKLRGRADLRDLTPDWRNQLCPVQTPESTDVGLVRFRTTGTFDEMAGEWSDVSASAALIPFLNHDDPARASIGSKNLKQALPVSGAEPPLVATGWEAKLAAEAGVAQAAAAGEVTAINHDTIELSTRQGSASVSFGSPWNPRSGPDPTWHVLVAVGDRVTRGQLLAHSPDVRRSDSGDAQLSLGVNALVALTPFHGLNYEDGIVVSQALADRMTSVHLQRVDENIDRGDVVTAIGNFTPGVGGHLKAGDPVVQIERPGTSTRTVVSPSDGEYLGCWRDQRRGTVSFLIRLIRTLEIGDKLSNRHQGKGVVSVILPTDQMPHLPDGHCIDAILNPLGVLRRLNLGQLWEMHAGLPVLLNSGPQIIVSRRVDDPSAIAAACNAVGAQDGRLPLLMPDGTALGGSAGVVVGPQYLMKLNHLASDKLSVRGGDHARSRRNGQPTQHASYRAGRRSGAAQRLGEMEVWALEAAGAEVIVFDAMRHRAGLEEDEVALARPSLRSVAAHLRSAGLEVTAPPGSRKLTSAKYRDIAALQVSLADDDLRTLDHELSAQSQTAINTFVPGAPKSADPAHHPLHREDLHGQRGSRDRETVQWAIDLPEPVPHPWRRTGWPALPDLECLPILPPAYRAPGLDPLDRRYQRVAELAAELRLAAADPTKDVAAQAARSALHETVDAVLGRPGDDVDPQTILGRLHGKRGLLRRWLLGQSTLYSGRSVLVPDPSRDPQSVGVPDQIAIRLGIKEHGSAYEDVVFLNRQPTLHPYNVVALRAEPVPGSALRVHPMIIGAIAGDFDGDTAAIHRPVRSEARETAWHQLSPAANLRSAAAGGLLSKTDLDISLGLHLLSTTAEGRRRLTALLEAPVTGPLTGRELVELIDRRVRAIDDPQMAIQTIAQIEHSGWQAATGWSIGALELIREGADGVLGQARAAGAAGKDSGISQLLNRRGSVPGGNPHLPVRDVHGNFLLGLTDDDYFATSPGSLAGLGEKKLTTPHAGALTKTLVEIADPVTIVGDCCGIPTDLASPLTCLGTTTICRTCYGPDRATGTPLRDGRRVGVLAATLIGERSTQLSMKSFHGGGGASSLGGGIGELRAVFGNGRDLVFGKAGTLHAWLLSQSGLGKPDQRSALLEPVVTRAVNILNGAVDRIHVEVIMRQLIDTAEMLSREPDPEGAGPFTSLAQSAEARGRSGLERATGRGNIRHVIAAAVSTAETPGSLRTLLVSGGLR